MFANANIVWISMFLNMALFLVIGVGLVIINSIFRKIPGVQLAVFIFTLLSVIDWVGLVFYESLYKWALLILASGIAAVVTRQFKKNSVKWMGFLGGNLKLALGLPVLIFLCFRTGEWLQEKISQARLPAMSDKPPNVLLIVVDTLRGDHVSSNGYYLPTTPNLDRFAENGVSFENAFSTSSYSLTSHVSLMTGKNVYEHGIEWEESKGLASKPYPTIAETMRKLGYSTGGFSANTYWVSREQGFNRGFIHFEDFYQTIGDVLTGPFFGRLIKQQLFSRIDRSDIPGRRSAADINKSVFNWIEDTDKEERPFFAFINYMDVHDPYLPPQPYRSMFSNQKYLGGLLNTEFGRTDPTLTSDQLQSEVEAYDGSIAYADHQIGELVAEIEQQSDRNLLVIVTSDHGEAFGEHGTYLHSLSLYREEIHVPLIVYLPDVVPSKTRISQPVSIISIPATILELIGHKEFASNYGRSLTELWNDKTASASWPDPLAEMAQQDWKPKRSPVYAGWIKSLINPKWQYIEYEKLDPELFGLREDPLQRHNLAMESAYRRILIEFQTRLHSLVMANN
jgi:arylsulfatase A-like enzyme